MQANVSADAAADEMLRITGGAWGFSAFIVIEILPLEICKQPGSCPSTESVEINHIN